MFDNESELRSFIVEAKRNTYAAGEGSKNVPSRLGAKDFPYHKGNYQYLDSYLGELDFAGQEVVWKDENAIWAMNYYGTTFDSIEGFPKFLFESLKLVSEADPYRGPKQHNDEQFEYICSWNGDLNQFSGEEKILYGGKIIYKLSFHGGSVKYL